MRRRYRVGSHHGITVIEIDESETPDNEGRRPSDRLICMGTSREDAQLIADTMSWAEIMKEG